MELAVLVVAALMGGVVGFYVAWRLCRASYLAVEKIFNLFFISLGCLGLILGVGWLASGWLAREGWSWGVAEALAVAVVMAGLVGWRYVKMIRYPGWKMLDMVSLAIGWAGLVGYSLWLVAYGLWQEGWATLAGTWMWLAGLGWLMVVVGGATWLYGRFKGREGMVGGWLVMGLFGMVLLWRMWAMIAWQEEVDIVEWVAVGIGFGLGLVLLIGRWWQPELKSLALQDTPKRVSADLQQTIGRTVAAKTAGSVTAIEAAELESKVAVSRTSGGVAVVISDESEIFAPPVEKPVKKLLKGRSRKATAKKKE